MNDPSIHRPFRWDGRKELAAEAVSAAAETHAEIAAKAGVSRQQLERWISHPDFQRRVEEHDRAWREHVRSMGIADRDRRIASYINDFDKTEELIKARATAMADVPGGATGLLVEEYRGKDADRPVYVFDAALLQARLNLRKQLAIELGEWSEKRELTGKGGAPMKLEIAAVDSVLESFTDDELKTLEEIHERASARKAAGIPPTSARPPVRIG